MKPIVINITNLIGKLVIITDKENTSLQIQELIEESLLTLISKVQNLDIPGLHQDKTL
jgi:hypothetical protein